MVNLLMQVTQYFRVIQIGNVPVALSHVVCFPRCPLGSPPAGLGSVGFVRSCSPGVEECPPGETGVSVSLQKCTEMIVAHLGYLNYTKYTVTVGFEHLKLPVKEIHFTVSAQPQAMRAHRAAGLWKHGRATWRSSPGSGKAFVKGPLPPGS